MWDFPLLPEQASTIAGKLDLLFLVLVLISLAFAIPIAFLIVVFAIKYRRGNRVDRSNPLHESLKLELTWIVIPLVLALGAFTWSAILYIEMSRPPVASLPIYVVGRQWMWKFQHPGGQREINQLHVPVGRPIKLIMASQDVIHSMYVPAFRMKQDVIPGRYTETWFQATKTGEYHLYCTEYCGSYHSEMIGSVTVMDPVAYEEWLSASARPGGGGALSDAPGTMAASGEQLFQDLGCSGCHRPDNAGRGPSLAGIFNQPQPLDNGQTAIADEEYLRESILRPGDKIVAGYDPIMPSYQGQIDEEQLLQIIEYIKGLDNSGTDQGQSNANDQGQGQGSNP